MAGEINLSIMRVSGGGNALLRCLLWGKELARPCALSRFV